MTFPLSLVIKMTTLAVQLRWSVDLIHNDCKLAQRFFSSCSCGLTFIGDACWEQTHWGYICGQGKFWKIVMNKKLKVKYNCGHKVCNWGFKWTNFNPFASPKKCMWQSKLFWIIIMSFCCTIPIQLEVGSCLNSLKTVLYLTKDLQLWHWSIETSWP